MTYRGFLRALCWSCAAMHPNMIAGPAVYLDPELRGTPRQPQKAR